MRVCPSCGQENGDNTDFCTRCGEYLRWEPTQHLQALKSSSAGAAVESHDDARDEPTEPIAGEVTLPPGAPGVVPHPPAPADVAASAPVVSPSQALGAPPPGAATLLLRKPDSEEQATGPLQTAVKPGERAILIALVRNESGIVDNYDIGVRGFPAGWWTATPATAYLVPYGPAAITSRRSNFTSTRPGRPTRRPSRGPSR